MTFKVCGVEIPQKVFEMIERQQKWHLLALWDVRSRCTELALAPCRALMVIQEK